MLLKADGVGENESVTNNNIPEVKGIMNDSSDEVDDDEDWGEEEDDFHNRFEDEVDHTLISCA